MFEESKHDRRHFLRNAAITIAAAEFSMLGFANAQYNKNSPGPKGE